MTRERHKLTDLNHEPEMSTWAAPTVPHPPEWKKEEEHSTNPTCELANTITEEQPKQMVMEGKAETGIADSGATSSCGKKMVSSCKNYGLDTSSLVTTGLHSNKIFRYAAGNLGVADKIRHLPFDVRGKAKEIHMTPGLENHLISKGGELCSGFRQGGSKCVRRK